MPSLAVALLILVSTSLCMADFQNHEAKEEVAGIQVDGFFGNGKRTDSLVGAFPFSRIYGFSFFPISTLAGKDLFGGVEFSILPRQIRNKGKLLNGPLLQSYGLGFGYQAMKSKCQEGFVYGVLGINSDMREFGVKAIYGDISYTHIYHFPFGLDLGGGIDIHYYFEDYFPYPIILLDWQLANHTKLKINMDTGELKQFFSENFSLSIGAQYDIFHYGFGSQKGYLAEATAAMVRFEYLAYENIYLRVSGKTPFESEETFWIDQSTKKVNKHLSESSIRFQLIYGL